MGLSQGSRALPSQPPPPFVTITSTSTISANAITFHYPFNMSTVMYLDHLPVKTESSFVSTLFDREEMEKIKDIYTYPDGSTCAWVVFKKNEDAKHAVARYDSHHFGPVGQKLKTSLCSEDSIPAGQMNVLTDFRHKLGNQLESCTIKITNLPNNHTGRSLNLLLEPVLEQFEMHVPGSDLDYGDFEPDKIIHSRVLESGVALLQLAKPDMARSIVHRFAGTYWKNATLNACCVPDEEMEELLAEHRNTADGKDVMLFVTGIKYNASTSHVRDIFKDFAVRDITMPPGGKAFCFIFLRQEDANSVLAQFGRGILHEGRMIRVSISDKGKKKNGGRTTLGGSPAATTPTPTYATTDLKINNLPYGVTVSTIRNVFHGFNLSKVIVKEGYAFVGIAANEVECAGQGLKGKKIGDRIITVKVAERRN